MIQISELDYTQYMHLLESSIIDYCYRINELYASIEKINNRYPWDEYKGSLTVEEIQNLIESFIKQQHAYFIKWYNLNKNLQQQGKPYYLPQKIRDIASYLKGIVRYTDLLDAA